MSSLGPALGQIALLVAALALAVPLLGRYLAHTYTSPKHLRVERGLYRVLRLDPDADQHWRTYTGSVLGFSLVGVLLLFALGRLQEHLPLSLGYLGLPADGAWNTAVSFVTNTNWQWYSGESTAGHLLQMSGLTVQNFVSAAVGMAVAAAFARGLGRSGESGRVGNFWADLVRGTLRVLLPVAVVSTVLLIACGATQNLLSTRAVTTLSGDTQQVTGGPVASQEAIKQLGTNGGGFYNVNAAHPFENPTPFTDLLHIFLMLLIPFAMAWAFGLIVRDRRQGAAVLSVMAVLLTTAVALLTWAELAGPGLAPEAAGGALEGKEVRFGTAASALYAAATTGTSTGAVNAMHDSLTAPGGGVALFNMMLGEIAPGGVGSGLYGMLMLAIVTVFLAGLMVGRTPEYLGKKIGQREVVLVACYVLATPVLVLAGIALAISADAGLAGLQEDGTHGLSEALYAVTSAASNNGSAFGGLTSGTPFWNTLLGLLMLLGRFVPIVLVLALAGRFAAQRRLPPSAGTLPTHRPLFVALLTGVALVVVGLTYVPVLALGPIAESLS
ncbi:potassium-transporting ATPase subunit KdpA [Nocardioides sp. zg-536]|uniref:Potassium-transporting ATPase potassium-binding subunit n=1 Tax=Nocardioides faecalis TaxID=2803858 RepID=A0A938YA47_9ACTN|nr:potassium-transporting ATPase subunit KdpA [Nocardioides faecalis]MBM9460251.1 potassium-transporting ATPase subunit KdpA [Nocardioides faecalis]MBS4754626.1 potassium-transporting ATPase subunit KdpA [Nocardioides faecalis]QVI59962.1 potassium-transporting ATPase subunit KdpA [Nocardioides faecalis]